MSPIHGIRKAARAHVKLSLHLARQSHHRLAAQWQQHVNAFESRVRAAHPKITRKRFSSKLLREADMEIHVLELQDLFQKMRPRFEVNDRNAYRSALTEFKSHALKWMSSNQFSEALQRLRQMGFIPMHGKSKQFHSGHFASEADAFHEIEKHRKKFNVYMFQWRVPRGIQESAWEAMLPFLLRRYMEFDSKKSSMNTFSWNTMRDAVRHYLRLYKKQNRPLPLGNLIPDEKPELKVHFRIRKLVERVGRENVMLFAEAALNPIELKLMEAELQGESYTDISVNSKLGRPLSLRGKRWHWGNAVKKLNSYFRKLVRSYRQKK